MEIHGSYIEQIYACAPNAEIILCNSLFKFLEKECVNRDLEW
jgi:hypothetical protein